MTLRAVVWGLVLALPLFLWSGCEKKPDVIYATSFDGDSLGPEWLIEGGDWRIEDGMLVSRTAMNKDLVLDLPLPPEAVIELKMRSRSEQVDIKFRAWGDKHAGMYAGAYHIILGGWGNRLSTIAPKGEHDTRRVVRPAKLAPDTWYQVRLVRHKGVITLYLDGEEYLRYEDREPLDPATHRYFSFANWKSDCAFDDLRITALR